MPQRDTGELTMILFQITAERLQECRRRAVVLERNCNQEDHFCSYDALVRSQVTELAFGDWYPEADYVNVLSHDYLLYGRPIDTKCRPIKGNPKPHYVVALPVRSLKRLHPHVKLVFALIQYDWSHGVFVGWRTLFAYVALAQRCEAGTQRWFGEYKDACLELPIERLYHMARLSNQCKEEQPYAIHPV